MKTQVYDRFGGGLLVLIMLTIAVVAGQAQPDFQEPAPRVDEIELDADFRTAIDADRLRELEALPAVIETVLDLPIRIEVSIEESESNLPDIADSTNAPVQ